MKANKSSKNLDELICRAIGREKPEFDFDKWKAKYKKEIRIHESQTADRQISYFALPVDIWRVIMKTRITKIAAAAVIVVALLIGLDHFGGSIDPASVAWGNVISSVANVDYVHFLFVADPQHHRSMRPYEGWYSHGKMVKCSWQGSMHYDDGQTYQYFDRHKIGGDKRPSTLKGQTFFGWISKGLLAEDNKQFTQQTPTSVGDDFLIYQFDPPEKDRNWIESIFITVGKNSLLPIQFKTHHKYDFETGEGIDDIEDGYTLVIFDYEAPEKPPEFFEPPTISDPPHGIGEIVLNDKEAMIDVSGARDMKTALIRLYSEPSQNNQEPAILADVAFILEDGVRSITAERIDLKLNQATRIGMGDVANWPDKKYRNISSTLVLRPTEKNGQVRCFSGAIRKQKYELTDREGMSVPVPGLFLARLFSFLFCKKL